MITNWTSMNINLQLITSLVVGKKSLAVENEEKFNMETSDFKTQLAIVAEKELAEEAIKRRVEELKGSTSLSRNVFHESSLLGS